MQPLIFLFRFKCPAHTTGNQSEEQHLKDIQSVVSYLKKRYDLPVWLLGFSNSTITVAHGAISMGDQIKGVILSSSITKVPPKSEVFEKIPAGVVAMNLSLIKLPVFIAAHKEDRCFVTLPDGAELIRKGLTTADVYHKKMAIPKTGDIDSD